MKEVCELNLNDFLSIGQNAVTQHMVEPSNATNGYSNAFPGLLATPGLLHWMIDASIDAIDPYLPDDYASIGISVHFVHTAPTSVGMTVTVHAGIIAITDHDITLSIKAWDEQGEIGHGIHKRAVVSKKMLMAKADERTKLLLHRQANKQVGGMQ